MSKPIRVVIPFHLCTLARVKDSVLLDVPEPITRNAILTAVESAYPMLRGTIRDHTTLKRRPFIRFFACNLDLTEAPGDDPVPEAVASGTEPFLVIGAIAGG